MGVIDKAKEPFTGVESWAFGKDQGLRACGGEDKVIKALDKIGGSDGGLKGGDRV